MEWAKLITVLVAGYLFGAIPFGLMIGLSKGVDLRARGSGKTGATNTLRAVGRRAAAAVFALDAGKGMLAVLLARLLAGNDNNWLAVYMGAAATAAIIGHSWSIWIKIATGQWGGGRGVSTSIGAMLAMYPPVALLAVLIGVAVIVVSRYVSLGSITGVLSGVALTVILVFFQQIPIWFLPWAVAIGALVVLLHHDNINRLLKGTERKFGQNA